MNAKELEQLKQLRQDLDGYINTGIDTPSPVDTLAKLNELIESAEKKQKNELSEFALNYWRLSNWVNNVNVERKMQANSALKKIGSYLDGQGIELRDLTGERYSDGFAADVIGIDSETDIPDDEMIVSEMVRPIILLNGTVVKYGQVVLGDKIKEAATNDEVVKEPDKAIPELVNQIDSYCKADYKEKYIAKRLGWCRRKLNNWLRKWRESK